MVQAVFCLVGIGPVCVFDRMLLANPSISSWPSRLSLSKFRTACQQVIPATVGRFTHGLSEPFEASSPNSLAFSNEPIVSYFCRLSSRTGTTFCLPHTRIFGRKMNFQLVNRSRLRTSFLKADPPNPFWGVVFGQWEENS